MTDSRFPLIDNLTDLSMLRSMAAADLIEFADQLRQKTIHTVAKTGGHLGAGLGVVELTVALHYCFNTPEDKLIWDVGHQTYPHKLITGRKDEIESLRTKNGLSGFTKRSESIFDPFGAGHSSTSISAALGIAAARDLKKENFESLAVIGDGALSAGMAYEAMNNASQLNSRVIVILNDNKMSIAPAVGSMSNYLNKLISSEAYLSFRNFTKKIINKLPNDIIGKSVKKAEQYTKDLYCGGNLFEEMGFYYIGPIDGHNLEEMIPIFKNIKADKSIKQPILLHIITEKGRGCKMEDPKKEKLHAVGKFDPDIICQIKSKSSPRSFTDIFSNELIKLGEQDDRIVAVTAAMPSGTGLDKFAEKFPDRTFDVAIAEQHAVTFAAGLSTEGYKPFVAIYSTFLQRAYDQIVHDVAIQNLPVRFAVDRADLVGADGPTHAGLYDVTYLSCLPNFIVMAAADEAELIHMIATAASINYAPCAFRYPRGEIMNVKLPEKAKILKIGKARTVKKGKEFAVMTLGTILYKALKAAEILAQKHNIDPTICDARFAKPIDKDILFTIATTHKYLLIIETNSIGGYAAQALKYLTDMNLLSDKFQVRSLCMPDKFIDHNHNIEDMYIDAGLGVDNIVENMLKFKRN